MRTIRTGRRGTSSSSSHSNAIAASVARPKAASDRYFTGNRKLFTIGTTAWMTGYTGVCAPSDATAQIATTTVQKRVAGRRDAIATAARSAIGTPMYIE